MCYHYSLIKTPTDLQERFDAALEEYEYISQYHVTGFSNVKMPVITAEHPKLIQPFHWGLIPSWVKSGEQAKEITSKGSTLNAKSETAFDLPSFRDSIERRRCLVLADGFFEWRQDPNDKIPHYISLKNQEAFAMAGIFDSWTDRGTGEERSAFSILTCEANPFMKKIHNVKMRMPVILPKEQEREWLNPRLSKEAIQSMCLAYPEEKMQAWTISKLISSRSENSNDAKVLERVEYTVQGSLF
jgi:putative SOS response-associated peptidase YedK